MFRDSAVSFNHSVNFPLITMSSSKLHRTWFKCFVLVMMMLSQSAPSGKSIKKLTSLCGFRFYFFQWRWAIKRRTTNCHNPWCCSVRAGQRKRSDFEHAHGGKQWSNLAYSGSSGRRGRRSTEASCRGLVASATEWPRPSSVLKKLTELGT